MHARHPDQIHANFRIAEAAILEPLLHDLGRPLRLRDGVDAGVRHLSFADVPVVVTDRHLVRRGPGLGLRSVERHAIGFHLHELEVRDVEHAIRRDVFRRVVQFVEQLLFAGGEVDAAAGIFELADPEAPVCGHVRIGKSEAREIGHVLLARIARNSRRSPARSTPAGGRPQSRRRGAANRRSASRSGASRAQGTATDPRRGR